MSATLGINGDTTSLGPGSHTVQRGPEQEQLTERNGSSPLPGPAQTLLWEMDVREGGPQRGPPAAWRASGGGCRPPAATAASTGPRSPCGTAAGPGSASPAPAGGGRAAVTPPHSPSHPAQGGTAGPSHLTQQRPDEPRTPRPPDTGSGAAPPGPTPLALITPVKLRDFITKETAQNRSDTYTHLWQTPTQPDRAPCRPHALRGPGISHQGTASQRWLCLSGWPAAMSARRQLRAWPW